MSFSTPFAVINNKLTTNENGKKLSQGKMQCLLSKRYRRKPDEVMQKRAKDFHMQWMQGRVLPEKAAQMTLFKRAGTNVTLNCLNSQ